ncbi:COG4315 family predicted lipoprotein [Streptomyces sp. NBC_01716]|uniref:COG4315 family predicted lipoprotein n=1 Tax=Streptomyces sp. NBC_01716 TaxID=2975917 RepID=UPI002E34E637|nr:hypothetical protein [Streptomyces sp. NBC_01716]
MRRHTRTVTALASALLLATAAAGCSDGGGDNGSAADTDTGSQADRREAEVVPAVSSSATPNVDVKNNNSLGKILVDNKGMTLYEFDKDTKNKSMCNGACAQQWPPFTVKTTPAAGSGVKGNLLKTTKRDDGSMQVTYNGRPLYHFADDTKAGQTNGQGLNAFGAKWYVMGPDGKKITKNSGNSSGGGGY